MAFLRKSYITIDLSLPEIKTFKSTFLHDIYYHNQETNKIAGMPFQIAKTAPQ